MEKYKYIYKPQKDELYLYKDQVVYMDSWSYGACSLCDLNGKWVDTLNQYSEEVDLLLQNKIGVRIKPMYERYVLQYRFDKMVGIKE